MACLAPSLVVNAAAASSFGGIAESVIAQRYLQSVGRSVFFPASQRDFQDFGEGFGNLPLFISFLRANNTFDVQQVLLLVAGGLVSIPDLMTHDPPRRMEYYEIKPNSKDGVPAGRLKLMRLSALFSSLGLPYVPGRIWKPSEKVLLWSGPIAGAWIEAYLDYFASPATNGLIVYELCIEGELSKALQNISLAVMIASVIVAILAIAPILVVA